MDPVTILRAPLRPSVVNFGLGSEQPNYESRQKRESRANARGVKSGHGVHYLELEGWFSGKNISSIAFQLKGFGVCAPLAPLAPFALNGSEDLDALAPGRGDGGNMRQITS